jgi:DNA-binding beta-propeller fold protein YncE
MKRAIAIAGVACACLLAAYQGTVAPVLAQGHPPRFEIDPTWPKPLPEGWITGRLGGVCIDGHDHVIVTNRRDITDEEQETSKQAPSVLIFDRAGSLVESWGDTTTVPATIHGCAADRENNIWITGSDDGLMQKYTHAGKLLKEIGKRGVVDTSDGTGKGKSLNASRTLLFFPSGLDIDPANGDLYVADGYGNRRVVVFDRDGRFLRQWGHQATKEETVSGAPGAFAQVVHCITLSNAGLVYVCDRQGDRVQVFDKMGNFQRNIWIRTGTPTLPDPRGTAWWVGFSRDPQQRFMYVMNGRNEQVHILDHASGTILSSFGRPGHQLGNFTHGHTLTTDRHGNVYVAETDTGRRIQKFRIVE